MDPKTGAVAQFETDEDAEKAGYTEKLAQAEADVLSAMNREERGAELSRMRKESPTDEERMLKLLRAQEELRRNALLIEREKEST